MIESATSAGSISAEASCSGRSKTECAHCGLPAPVNESDAPAFCCHGCEGAYRLIRGWGLEEYYELRDAGSQPPVDASPSKSFADLDDPQLLGRSAPFPVQAAGGQLLKSRLSLTGLHCVACVWLIERACQRVEGWRSSTVNFHARTLDVVYDPTAIRLSAIGEALYQLGYTIAPLGDPLSAQGRQRSTEPAR